MRGSQEPNLSDDDDDDDDDEEEEEEEEDEDHDHDEEEEEEEDDKKFCYWYPTQPPCYQASLSQTKLGVVPT